MTHHIPLPSCPLQPGDELDTCDIAALPVIDQLQRSYGIELGVGATLSRATYQGDTIDLAWHDTEGDGWSETLDQDQTASVLTELGLCSLPDTI
jgi:hypothetical protein